MEADSCESDIPNKKLRRSTRLCRNRSRYSFSIPTPEQQRPDKHLQKSPSTLDIDETDLKKIEKYYLDKKVKRASSSLETIFEEPVNEKVMSSRKSVRVINFHRSNCALKMKSKKRQTKAKTVFLNKKKWKKISVDLLMKTLSILEQQEEQNKSD